MIEPRPRVSRDVAMPCSETVRRAGRTALALLLLALGQTGFAQSPDLQVQPRNGQSEQQQWSDRYACHAWARSQSGIDPTQAGAAVTPDSAARLARYRNAMTACLQARGYAAQYGVAPAPAPEPAAPAPPVAVPAPLPRMALPPAPPAPPLLVQRELPAPQFQYRPLAWQIEGGDTITQDSAAAALRDGWNLGLGLTWYPSPSLPLGLRADGTYSRFGETWNSLSQYASAGMPTFGHEDLYGGDLDLELDLPLGPRMKEYFVGGVGWYSEQTTVGQISYEQGLVCGFYFCGPGTAPVASIYRDTSDVLHSWNAGLGLEFAIDNLSSFFIEARYQRLQPASSGMNFIPIRVGFRF